MTPLCDFYVEKRGHENTPGILFLHGFLGSSSDWLDVMSVLSEQFFCLALDLPGHGQTLVRDDDIFSMSSTASALVALLQKWPDKKWTVIGYSMGGRLALYLALMFPERFSSGVVISGSPGLDDEEERKKRRQNDQVLITHLRQESFETFLTSWYEQPLFATLKNRPEFVKIRARRVFNDPMGLAKSLEHMGLSAQPSLWHRLRGCSVPLLFVCGEADQKFVNIAEQMSRNCEGAELQVIEDCGHNVHVEAQDSLIAVVQDFLSREKVCRPSNGK